MQANRFYMLKSAENLSSNTKKLRKMSKNRLKNIALHYLERFDSSADNLRQVLKRRLVNYARQTDDFDLSAAETWIEEIITDFERLGYVNDLRFAEFKIDDYLNAGKPERYIRQKMMQKGIDENTVDGILQNREFDEEAMAARFARKKKIGPWRSDEESRRINRQKDLATIVRAGFNYDTAQKIINAENPDDLS